MEQQKKRFLDSRILVGVLIIAAGILLLLDKMGMDFNLDIGGYWPLILIVIGLGKIIQPQGHRHLYTGIVITIIGTLFLLNNLGYIHFWFKDLWPVLIILVGIEILRHGFFKPNGRIGCWKSHDSQKTYHKGLHNYENTEEFDKERIDISIMLGSGTYRVTNKLLKGGQISVLMGGCELDLREAEMEPDQITLDISSIMGGVELNLPPQWEVVVQGNPILGGIEDKTLKPKNPTKKLFLNASAIMSGVEVRN